jgi:4-hydroxybenzoate polyprenyltransferase
VVFVTTPVLRLLRPHHWTKNLLVFAGVVFGGRLSEPGSWALAAWTFVLFCMASSAVYAVNDVVDRHRDALHPIKRSRPLPAGEIRSGTAWLLGVALGGSALVGAWILHGGTFVCMALYLGINLAYSAALKHVALLDVMAIALGFVFRLLAGIYVLQDLPTSWIVLCTFFLAVFLGFAKRRAELVGLLGRGSAGEGEPDQRPVLVDYSLEYLDGVLGASATMAVLCYALFTVTADKNHFLIATVPVVYYAVLHYKRMAMVHASGEEPERILLSDPRIPLSILVWVVLYVVIELWNPTLFV